MKTYELTLKGTKKNKTSDLTIHVYGTNKGQAYNYAYNFFQKGKFQDPYFAEGVQRQSGGTLEFIPKSNEMRDLAGKYFVPKTALKIIK